MKVAYYPGCSLEGTAKDYAESILGICNPLGVQLHEVPDWNCCGATAAHSIDHRASIGLTERVLNLATEMPYSEMLIPCPMCFNRLKTASCKLQGDHKDRYQTKLRESVPKLWDLADFFATDEMLKRVTERIKKPLRDLRLVSYYGCMANRPPEITAASDCENPLSMDRIMENLGGTPIPWPFKTDCCGAMQMLSRPDIVSTLVEKLFHMARRVGAQGVVVSCQMCQANLDMFQARAGTDRKKRLALPVYYFSELIGLALEVKGVRRWLKKHFTDPIALLRELGLWEKG
jgi:heterodisulfide reductase subunit B